MAIHRTADRSRRIDLSLAPDPDLMPDLVLDHVFICCDAGAPEAEALRALGLVEGSGNVHPGQGTANRRFFFDGGFLELLWVADPEEARSDPAATTRLWPRWSGRRTGACPFGIAFGPAGDRVGAPPFATRPYRPSYLPPDKAILFAEGTHLEEPELLYLAWPHPLASSSTQPRDHANGLRRLRSVSVGLPAGIMPSAASMALQSAGLLSLHEAEAYTLTLGLEGRSTADLDLRPTLPLVLSSVR